MASTAQMNELTGQMSEVSTTATGDIMIIWSSVATVAPEIARDTLLDIVPAITQEYGALAAELSTQWYVDLAPERSFTPTPVEPADTDQIAATVRWAVGPLFGGDRSLVPEQLAGGVQRHVTNTSRETLLDNASSEKGTRWARHASPGACGWCRMLAIGDPVYRSKKTALKSHDWCNCTANVVRPGEDFERPAYAKKWKKDYEDARDEVGGKPNDIVNYLRRNGAREPYVPKEKP